MKIKAKVTISTLILSLAPVLVAGFILSVISYQLGTQIITKSGEDNLVALRESRSTQIQDYFNTIANQVVTFSASRMIIDAAQEFNKTFKEVPSHTESMKSGVLRYYRDRSEEHHV